jgi:hypothetical protein
MLADHVDVAACWCSVWVGGCSSFYGSIEHNAAADPSVIDALANFGDPTTSIGTTNAWPGGLDSRQAAANPKIEMIHGACFGLDKYFACGGRRSLHFL